MLVLNSTQEKWDSIKGYTSGLDCPICGLDILVKTGIIEGLAPKVAWGLCHVCFDKGWAIPIISEDGQQLIYFNGRNGEIEMVDIII